MRHEQAGAEQLVGDAVAAGGQFLTAQRTSQSSQHDRVGSAELELRIVRLTVPDLDETLAASVVRLVGALREMRLRKSPSVAETIDWANTLLALGAGEERGQGGRLDEGLIARTLGVVLKHRPDLKLAVKELKLG